MEGSLDCIVQASRVGGEAAGPPLAVEMPGAEVDGTDGPRTVEG